MAEHDLSHRGIIVEAEPPIQEECGIVAIYSFTDQPGMGQFERAAEVALGVSHRGHDGTGILLRHADGNQYTFRSNERPEQALISDQLDHDSTSGSLRYSLVHCRYGTNGQYSDINVQPITTTANDGSQIAVIHNGNIPGIKRPATVDGSIPEGASDTYVLAANLAHAPEANWDDRVARVMADFHGAFSVVIAVGDRLYVSRDKLGVRPMVMGRRGDEVIVTSETSGLDRLGLSATEVRPGSIFRIDQSGLTTISEGVSESRAACGLELAYFAHQDSLVRPLGSETMDIDPETAMSNYQFRVECGRVIARELGGRLERDALVVAVPNSGLSVGEGFADEADLPFDRSLIRKVDGANTRTFMTDHDKDGISTRVSRKLEIMQDARWKGSTVYLLDDSIIRGNVSKVVAAELRRQGARKIILVSGFPPFIDQCHLGVSTRTREELIATRHLQNGRLNKASLAEEIGVDEVIYISNQGFLEARGHMDIDPLADPKTLFLQHGECGGCVTGEHPLDIHGALHPAMIQRMERIPA